MPTVWAEMKRRQVSIAEQGEASGNVADAVVLAKTYGILGRYTSLLALESDEMYAQYGIARVVRDEAGIALEAVSPSRADESRIGGEGVEGEDVDLGGEGDAASGCSCAAPAGRARPALAVGLFLLAAALCRRRPTRA